MHSGARDFFAGQGGLLVKYSVCLKPNQHYAVGKDPLFGCGRNFQASPGFEAMMEKKLADRVGLRIK